MSQYFIHNRTYIPHYIYIQYIYIYIYIYAFQKSYKLICILMSEIIIYSHINQQDFWLPGVLKVSL